MGIIAGKQKRRAKGTGSSGWVTINGKKYWRIYFRGNKSDITGKPRIKPIYGKTKEEAEAKLAQILDTEETQIQSDIAFGEFFHNWLWNVKRGTIKNSTFESLEIIYRNHISHMRGLYNKRITEIDTFYIQSITDLLLNGYSVKTVRRINSAIRSCLNHAVKQRIIKQNPVSNIAYYQKERIPTSEYLSPWHQQRILDAVRNTIYEGIMMCGIYCGMRSNEILALKTSDICFKGKYINVDKQVQFVWTGQYLNNKKEYKRTIVPLDSARKVPLCDSLAEILQYRIQQLYADKEKYGEDFNPLSLVFYNKDGTFVGNNSPNNAFRGAISHLHLTENITFSSTRKMFIINCFRAGIDNATIAEWTGHTESTVAWMRGEYAKAQQDSEEVAD